MGVGVCGLNGAQYRTKETTMRKGTRIYVQWNLAGLQTGTVIDARIIGASKEELFVLWDDKRGFVSLDLLRADCSLHNTEIKKLQGRNRWEAVIQTEKLRNIGQYLFHTKDQAVGFAHDLCKRAEFDEESDVWALVLNCRNGHQTRMLSSHRCSCRVCGNELEGKQHCPLCGALHSYM